LSQQYSLEAVKKVTGCKRKGLAAQYRCGEAGGGDGESIQETISQRSASEGLSLGSSQSEEGMVERRAWAFDEMHVGFRDLEEWGMKRRYVRGRPYPL
jgi:hypothetical protein